MTRLNSYITPTIGDTVICASDSSSAAGQGYRVESLLLPRLSLSEADGERARFNGHCSMNELRCTATSRYQINLQNKTIAFFDQIYSCTTAAFRKGKDLTQRYTAYLLLIKNNTL